MNWLTATLYGVIQGLTEFLPVSSSGHLALLPIAMEFKDPGVLFDLAMHVGTAMSIIVYFHKELIDMVKEFIGMFRPGTLETTKRPFVLNIIISSFTTFVVVLIIKNPAEEFGRNSTFIGINLCLFGILMFISDWRGIKSETSYMYDKVQPGKAIWIGLFQAFAIFPGVSRSGSTLTISRFMGLSRQESTRFSFLLSLPIILGGFFLKLPEMIRSDSPFQIAPCLWGGVISFVVGFVTIHYFLKLIQKIGLGVFSLYRLILGGFIFWLL